jgi:hypothetical protein
VATRQAVGGESFAASFALPLGAHWTAALHIVILPVGPTLNARHSTVREKIFCESTVVFNRPLVHREVRKPTVPADAHQ